LIFFLNLIFLFQLNVRTTTVGAKNIANTVQQGGMQKAIVKNHVEFAYSITIY